MNFDSVHPGLRPMVDAIQRDQILRARQMTPEERFAEALDLMDFAYEVMENGVRTEHPEANDEEVTQLLRKKLSRLRYREDYGLFSPPRKIL
ncbi:hypothetical protein SAMN02745166_00545 [Prosthecobacter debontii]|uniref:Uncharacterized protein n=1 Tax=Prosthecobacter debontii TaxID=48467 RepID=A0A1T4WRU1_9BACT|nr:hypothetical protein [Prosthecobacter debontii]SKA79807.1 hypothetical protein SAMN02745166_00545 [Prosthecobacter debontii]